MAMACAIAIIFLPAVTRQPFSTPALGFTSEPAFLACCESESARTQAFMRSAHTH